MNGRKLNFWSVAAKAERDMEPYYKLMWHNAGVEILDNVALKSVLIDFREKDQAAFGSTAVGDDEDATRMTALAKHISTLDATTLEDIFGPSTKHIKRAIKTDALARVLVKQALLELIKSSLGGVGKISEVLTSVELRVSYLTDLTNIIIPHREARFNVLCMMHGDVEG